jgi:hypothetical protein
VKGNKNMKQNILKQAVLGALLAVPAVAANAATVTFNYNYLAGASAAATPSATISTSANLAASGAAGYSLGTITFTDLTDLNLGDNKTGVRMALNLDFAPIKSATANSTVYLSSFETNFLGTSTAGVGGTELSSLPNSPGGASSPNLGNNVNWRHVSGQTLSNIRAGGAIEFAEDGNVNGWGVAAAGQPADPSFEQENNYAAGAYTGGLSVIDFLNGDNGYTGFSVAGMLANPVHNVTTDTLNPGARPDAFSWLKLRSVDGGIAASTAGLLTATNNVTGVSTQSLNIIAAVPVPASIYLFLTGLAGGWKLSKRNTKNQPVAMI